MICSRCFKDYPISEFYPAKKQCRSCHSEIRLFNWRKHELEKIKQLNVSNDYKDFNKVNIQITFEKSIPENVIRLINALKEINND